MFVFCPSVCPWWKSFSPRSFFHPRTITAIFEEKGYFPKIWSTLSWRWSFLQSWLYPTPFISCQQSQVGWLEKPDLHNWWKPLQYWWLIRLSKSTTMIVARNSPTLFHMFVSWLHCWRWCGNSVWFDWKCTEWPQDGEHNLLTHFANQT